MTDNRIERRVLTYIRRRADGKFMFPHAVRAHLADTCSTPHGPSPPPNCTA